MVLKLIFQGIMGWSKDEFKETLKFIAGLVLVFITSLFFSLLIIIMGRRYEIGFSFNLFNRILLFTLPLFLSMLYVFLWTIYREWE